MLKVGGSVYLGSIKGGIFRDVCTKGRFGAFLRFAPNGPLEDFVDQGKEGLPC